VSLDGPRGAVLAWASLGQGIEIFLRGLADFGVCGICFAYMGSPLLMLWR